MIIVGRNSWLSVLFKWRGTPLARTWRRVLFVTVVAAVITTVDLLNETHFHPNLTPLPFQLVGLALGIFLGFRNNTSYDRFWEGRKLWGALVNTSRTFTRQALTLVGNVPDGRRATDGASTPYPGAGPSEGSGPDAEALRAFHVEMVRRMAAYVHCLRHHLRDEEPFEKMSEFLPAREVQALRLESNWPAALLQTMAHRIRHAWERGWIHPQHVPALDASLTSLCDIQGGCERIKSTPIPFSYTALIHRIVALYCFALPFGIVATVGAYTPVVVAIISYAFFGLDAVGDEIEDPFGKDANDLPLTSLSTMIEINVRQRIGDQDLPARVQPVDGVLQ
jgi:putative membrane protein